VLMGNNGRDSSGDGVRDSSSRVSLSCFVLPPSPAPSPPTPFSLPPSESSWAITAVTAVEMAYAIVAPAYPNLPPAARVSLQQVLECEPSNSSCSGGGWPTSALDYMVDATQANGGLATEAAYPYTQKQGGWPTSALDYMVDATQANGGLVTEAAYPYTQKQGACNATRGTCNASRVSREWLGLCSQPDRAAGEASSAQVASLTLQFSPASPPPASPPPASAVRCSGKELLPRSCCTRAWPRPLVGVIGYEPCADLTHFPLPPLSFPSLLPSFPSLLSPFPPSSHTPQSKELLRKTAPKAIGVIGYDQVDFFGWLGLTLAVQTQPTIAFVRGSHPTFLSYRKGTYSDRACAGGVVDHSVVVVGYELDNYDTLPYWIIRNSWGDKWGEKGYMRMAMVGGIGICGIHSVPAIYPVIKTPSPCNDQINPCGWGDCEANTADPSGPPYVCSCADGFVPATNSDGTPTCALDDVCSWFEGGNPCGVGSCLSDNEGGYLCLCPPGFKRGLRAGGTELCVPTAERPSTVSYPMDVDCELVYQIYGLEEEQFLVQNPDL
ncbi:unnamed protein product, partial [Closterium sp. Naga37s-1]